MELSAKACVKKNIRKQCGVFGCSSKTNSENLDLSYHLLPTINKSFVEVTSKLGVRERVDRRVEWIKRLKIQNPFDNMRVCSAHFVSDDFFFPELEAGKRQLRKHAVPSRNLPVSSVVKAKSQTAEKQVMERAERAVKRQKFSDCQSVEKQRIVAGSSSSLICGAANSDVSPNLKRFRSEEKEKSPLIDSEATLQCQFSPCDSNIPLHQVQPVLNSNNSDQPLRLHECCCKTQYKKVPDMMSKAVQVTCDDVVIPFSSILTSDRKLNSVCGIHSHKLLDQITCAMERLYPEKRVHKLTVRDRIILTMMKLKLDLTFKVLSTLFDSVSAETCSKLFFDTLKKLSTILKPMISCISKKETLRTMPKCFVGLENTIVVVDCIEFSVQKPKCLTCQNKVYSQFKSDYTAKFMTGVSPGGLLVFVSEAYGGRASDKAIFEQSKIINLMNRGDAVMVDKDFMIDDICNKNGVQLYRPSFLNKRSQLSKEEAVYSRKIASARVHVERMNQRIREYDVLNNRIESILSQNIDDIMFVCCAFANLGTSILADDKYM